MSENKIRFSHCHQIFRGKEHVGYILRCKSDWILGSGPCSTWSVMLRPFSLGSQAMCGSLKEAKAAARQILEGGQ